MIASILLQLVFIYFSHFAHRFFSMFSIIFCAALKMGVRVLVDHTPIQIAVPGNCCSHAQLDQCFGGQQVHVRWHLGSSKDVLRTLTEKIRLGTDRSVTTFALAIEKAANQHPVQLMMPIAMRGLPSLTNNRSRASVRRTISPAVRDKRACYSPRFLSFSPINNVMITTMQMLTA